MNFPTGAGRLWLVFFAAAELVLLASATLLFRTGSAILAWVPLVLALALLLAWLAWTVLRRLLWRVGRQLAFSYLVIGMLPIPMALLLAATAAYLVGGALVGHLFRDALGDVQEELVELATSQLGHYDRGVVPPTRVGDDLLLAYYRDGWLEAGEEWAPKEWPGWLADRAERRAAVTIVEIDGERLGLAVAAERSDLGVLLLMAPSSLSDLLTFKSDLWVSVSLKEENPVRLSLGEAEFILSWPSEAELDHRARYFGDRARGRFGWNAPILFWGESIGGLYHLDGELARREVAVLLNATPRRVYDTVVSSVSQLDVIGWVLLFILGFLLFDVYALAAIVAVVMIWGLSRAVNRLSSATETIQRGDFGARIPVRRRDQLGDLQRSFNHMADSLEQLVATAAEKEVLEKELALARELQERLIPEQLVEASGVRFASSFEPSAAIGGDYFDLFRLDDTHLAVVIADVAGHGLSAGLRMAMIKAGLVTLIDEGLPARDVLARLDRMVRTERHGRAMVTLTLGLLDLAAGRLEVTNAGHCPTYLSRGGKTTEILLPSSPLGALRPRYAEATVDLQPGDLVVWLSDGLIEAATEDGDQFGYDRLAEVIAQPAVHPDELRDRILDAVRRHTGGRAPADDRTLLVLHYHGRADGAASPT